MAETCGEPHPDHPGVLCDKPVPCWVTHQSVSASMVWDGNPPPSRSAAKSAAQEGRKKAKPQKRTGPPVPTRQPQSEGVPEEAVEAWERDQAHWIETGIDALRRVCLDYDEFTTEQVWQKVDDTPEKRAMVRVMAHGKRNAWLTDSGNTVYVNWNYCTRDGVQFPLNKNVPIYRSRLRAPLDLDDID